MFTSLRSEWNKHLFPFPMVKEKLNNYKDIENVIP